MLLETALKFKSKLVKYSPSFFTGYQDRYFQVVEGDISKGEDHYLLTYAEKEKGKIKGAIPFNQITKLSSLSKKEFNFYVGDRQFKLKAEKEQLKNDWIEAITLVKKETKRKEQTFRPQKTRTQQNSEYSSKSKDWKTKNTQVTRLGDDGKIISEEQLSSDKCFTLKGIKPFLRGIHPDLLKTRLKYGFMSKKHKNNYMSSQKRWLFLVSARPILEKDLYKDEETLDVNSLPTTISFDTLYYYSYDDENDKSTFKGELQMSECSGISVKENEQEYYIIIDMNDRIFEFSTENAWERDNWFEIMKNSKLTGRDVELSKTKKPRNMAKLNEAFLVNEIEGVEKILEEEIKILTFGFDEIKNPQILQAFIKKIDTKLIQTVDGALLCNPVPMEILTTYCEKYNSTILEKFQIYWKYLSENLSVSLNYF
jgi:hypothetical protein